MSNEPIYIDFPGPEGEDWVKAISNDDEIEWDNDPITASVTSTLRKTWNALLHPRGRDGRFIDVGDFVDVFDRPESDTPIARGEVVDISPGEDSVKVRVLTSTGDTPQGAVIDVPNNDIEQSRKFVATLDPCTPHANQYTKWASDKQGPPAMTLEDAQAAGFTDGPYYHATNHAQQIMDEGFLTKGAETWEANQWGSIEEFKKFDSVNQVWLSPNPEDVVGYGNDTIEMWVKPGAAKEGMGSAFGGGTYVADPTDAVPIADSIRPSVKKPEQVDAYIFQQALDTATADNARSAYLTHYTPDEINGMQARLLANDGQTGVLVHDHGDGRIEGTALFNTDGRGAGSAILKDAVDNYGVNYVEAFGPTLPKLYEKLGFITTDQFPFDPEQAPPDWDYEANDSPDYFLMGLPGAAATVASAMPNFDITSDDFDPVAFAAYVREHPDEFSSDDPEWDAQYGEAAREIGFDTLA